MFAIMNLIKVRVMETKNFIKVFFLVLFCGISLSFSYAEDSNPAVKASSLGYYTTTNTSGQISLQTENYIESNQDVNVSLNATGLKSCKWTLETPETAGCTPLSGTSSAFGFCVGDKTPAAVTFKVTLDYGNGPEILVINFRVRKIVG